MQLKFFPFTTITFSLKAKGALLIFLVLMSRSITAQNDQIEPVIPPSPNAASLGMYGQIPVSLYTGTPSVNVPLYTLQGRDIAVPISLSYHASGVKVDQRPSHVGLGWSLNAGGVVIRTVKGKPDEDGSSGYWSLENKY